MCICGGRERRTVNEWMNDAQSFITADGTYGTMYVCHMDIQCRFCFIYIYSLYIDSDVYSVTTVQHCVYDAYMWISLKSWIQMG